MLVAGLLLVGLVAGRDGLFDAAASLLDRLPGPPVVLLLACFALVAVVTALLNLDTAAVFLTPVLIGVARRRGLEVIPFLYGSVFMANASSLFLPGSNLTNLLVLSGRHVSGATFFTRMLPAALAAPAITAAGLVAMHRRKLFVSQTRTRQPLAAARLGAGLWGALLAAGVILALSDPAPAVLAIGVALVALRCWQTELTPAEALSSLGAPVLLCLFGVSVVLGTTARASAFPVDVIHSAGAPLTAAIAAIASVAVNNLPAAVLLSAKAPAHASALLLGLNVGPNLAVTGSLAVLLWWRAARAVGAKPSAAIYSWQGLLLAPLAIAGSLALTTG